MPIKLSDIEVDIETLEYEEDPDEFICKLCSILLDKNRSDYKPIPHTLDTCLGILFNRSIGEPRI